MSRLNLKKGRTNQKLRTRKALLDAADQLVTEGRKLTLARVAEKAMVSRATAYRYFPSLEALLLEVALAQKVESAEQILREADDLGAAERVGLVHDFLYQLIVENEQQCRLFLRASMEQWLKADGDTDAPLRGARRIPMLSLALEPWRGDLDEETYSKLLCALSAMVSLEPFIALVDVCQLKPDEGREVSRWAVETLVHAVLDSNKNQL